MTKSQHNIEQLLGLEIWYIGEINVKNTSKRLVASVDVQIVKRIFRVWQLQHKSRVLRRRYSIATRVNSIMTGALIILNLESN
jgi:hypothetical protein